MTFVTIIVEGAGVGIAVEQIDTVSRSDGGVSPKYFPGKCDFIIHGKSEIENKNLHHR
jgi:hypothetical protein